MLQIRNLTITHKKDLRTIIENFSINLQEHDKVVIIGEEGNGKSTLLKLIYDPTLVDTYVEYTGDVICKAKMGYLSQELLESHGRESVYDFFSTIQEFFELTPLELSHMCHSLKISVELLYSEQSIHELSGGEKVKIQIARLLMTKPGILLLDEPSNDLDIETLQWLEEFINHCSQPILYISHDEYLIQNTANRVVHIEQIMRKTKSIYTISNVDYDLYKNERENRLKKQEQNARNEKRVFDNKLERYMQIRQKVENNQNSISRQDPHGGALLKKKMKNITSMGKKMEKEKENLTRIPDVEDAMFIVFANSTSLPSSKRVIDIQLDQLKIEDRVLARNIELLVRGNEKICIVGKNGVGKTTLIKYLKDILRERMDIKVGYLPQNYEDLLDKDVSAVEYLSLIGDKEELTRIRTYLASMKYTKDEMEHPISELSGGQKAKVLLLKMSLSGTNVLILDEPTRNFSPLSSPMIREVLKNYNGCIISISHDRKYISDVCDTVYELSKDGLRKINN